MADVTVKIGADATELTKAMRDVENSTDDVKKSVDRAAIAMNAIGQKAEAAFRAIVGSVTDAVHAFNEAEVANNKLKNALSTQGLVVNDLTEAYEKQAEAISEKTGIEDNSITSAQAVLQTYIGQVAITEEMTEAIVDLSTKTGSLESAAEQLGKAYGGNVTSFKKMRISIDENATASERLGQAVTGVNAMLGGSAEAIAKTSGSTKLLLNAYNKLVEVVGKKLAPAFDFVVDLLTRFFVEVRKQDELLSFAIGVLEVVAAFGAIASAVIAVTSGVAAFAAGLELLAPVIGVTSLAMGPVVLAIGAISAGLFLLYKNWSTIWPAIKGVVVGAVTAITEHISGVSGVLSGIFNGDFDEIKEGFDKLTGSLSKGVEVGVETAKAEKNKAAIAAVQEEEDEKLEIRRAAARKAQEERERQDQLSSDESFLAQEIARDQASGQSSELIKIKQDELALIKRLKDEDNAETIVALEEQLEKLSALERSAEATNLEEQALFQQQILATNAEFAALTLEQKELFLAQNKAQLQTQVDTESEARNKIVSAGIKQQIDANNKYLENQQKFKTAYAEINRVVYSTPVTEAQKGFSQLSSLQQSNNATLKSIGKAAAVADITIKTAQSAMSIYTAFTSIPFIGPALGVAGAAAAIAFGGEQIGRVLSAQSGGMVPGFNRGGDSVPSLLQPGELVVPRANFGEVVNAVASQRVQESPAASSGVATGGSAQSVTVSLAFSGDNAEKFLTAKQVEARSLGTLREARSS